MKKYSRRALLLAAGGAIGYSLNSRLQSDLPSMTGTKNPLSSENSASTLNDASELSATNIHRHLRITSDYDVDLHTNIRMGLQESRKLGIPYNVGAARHTMGGQAIPRDGIAVTFDNGSTEIDSTSKQYRVHAGARWSQVINSLDAKGWSPKITQANHDFGIAATFSVNAHGWQVPFGPMGSSVRAIRMIMPSGELLECSRTQNQSLFNHVMGGYGLIGVITDLDIEMVPNSLLVPTFSLLAAEQFPAAFKTAIEDPDVKMAYGRLQTERKHFFEQALLRTYSESDVQGDLPSASGSSIIPFASRNIYRAQTGNESMKSFRWWSETTLGPRLLKKKTTRNALINEPAQTLADTNPERSDILHEYFVSFDRFDEFLEICREVIPASFQELLNVTLRYVATDQESTLAYATSPRIAAVMSFSQEKTERAEADMQRMTQELIERIIDIGGTYYLPYRPHATLAQFARAYPECESFATAKRQIDPDLLLRNNLWDTYMARL